MLSFWTRLDLIAAYFGFFLLSVFAGDGTHFFLHANHVFCYMTLLAPAFLFLITDGMHKKSYFRPAGGQNSPNIV